MAIDWNALIAISSLGQFVVVTVAAFLGLRQLKHMRRSSELEASLPILAWIRNAEYQAAYPLVLSATAGEHPELRAALRSGNGASSDVLKVLALAHFLNQLGILVEKDLIKGSTIIPYYRDAIVMTWELFVPFVALRRREEHGSSFFAPFEGLVLRARAISADDRFASVRGTLPRSLRPAFDRSLTTTRSGTRQ